MTIEGLEVWKLLEEAVAAACARWAENHFGYPCFVVEQVFVYLTMCRFTRIGCGNVER